MRVNLVRSSYPRLKWKLGTTAPLGEYITDAMGNCPVLVTNRTKRVLDSGQLMATPVDPSSDFGANFTPAFLPMAEQVRRSCVHVPSKSKQVRRSCVHVPSKSEQVRRSCVHVPGKSEYD